MDLRNKSILEIVKGDRIHSYHCENSSPLGEIYDCLQEMLKYVVDRINSSAPKVEKEEENQSVEDIKVE